MRERQLEQILRILNDLRENTPLTYYISIDESWVSVKLYGPVTNTRPVFGRTHLSDQQGLSRLIKDLLNFKEDNYDKVGILDQD